MASYKVDRIKLQQDFEVERTAWRSEKGLDEVVSAEDIAEVVASWTGIPVTSLLEEEAQKLLRMEEELAKRIVGQKEAIAVLSDALRRARSGLKDPRRPIGSFIFLGTSGVGKTELAKALAEFLFDDEDALLRIDMSEYRERALGQPLDGRTARLRRLRRGRAAQRGRAAAALSGDPVR